MLHVVRLPMFLLAHTGTFIVGQTLDQEVRRWSVYCRYGLSFRNWEPSSWLALFSM